MAALLKSPSTNRALKRLYIGVGTHVLAKVHRLRETLAANHTLERFHLGVGSQVLVQPSLLCERFWTEGANKGANTRVHPHVLL